MISGEKWMLRWRSRDSSSKTASLFVIDGAAESTARGVLRRRRPGALAGEHERAGEADRDRRHERQEAVQEHGRDDRHLVAAEGHQRTRQAELDDPDAA